HWHVLAGFDVIILVLGIALWLSADRSVLPPRWLLFVSVFAVLGITVSVTATSAIGAAASLLLLGGLARRLGRILRAAVPAGGAATWAFGPLVRARVQSQGLDTAGGSSSLVPQTVAYRLDIWTTQYIPAIKASPVTGYGAQLPDRISWQWSESIYFS